jgi:hypothetical protein
MDVLTVKKPLEKCFYTTLSILCIVGASNLKHVSMREHWFSTALVCLLIVTFGIHGSLVSTAYSAEWSASEKALSFLTDVVKLDTTKYNVTLVGDSLHYDVPGWEGLSVNWVTYNLESKESKLQANFDFVNKTLWVLHLDVDKGSPLYAEQPSANVLERVDVFLQRYQKYTVSDCQEMRDILATVIEVKNMTTSMGNVTLDIKTRPSLGSTSDSKYTTFRWRFIYNGAEFQRFSIAFGKRQEGDLACLDTRLIYKIGSTDVNVSKEEAIKIARERAKNLTWWAHMGNYSVEVSNFTIVDDFTEAGLLTAPREPLVLYPYWAVTLYFDKFYPGNVYGVTYDIWADTGEVFNGFLRFFLGGNPSEDSTEPINPTEPIVIPEFPDIDLTPPTISILSPENKTYTTNSVSLRLEFNEATTWVGYSLDGQANLTLQEIAGLYDWPISALLEHLNGLPDGTHSIVVYAEDTAGNTGASETIYFTISQETESQEPPPDDSADQTRLDPTPLLIAVPIVLIITLGVAVYRRRKIDTSGKAEKQFMRE